MTKRATNGFGTLLKHWRALRQQTQLDLALATGVSARHVSFLETGRALPSRQMVITLSIALDVPLRDRNALMLAAGFAPAYAETRLDDARMRDARVALEAMLRRHEPYSALVCDRHWNLVMANAAHVEFLKLCLGARAEGAEAYSLLPAGRFNVIDLVFDPDGFRPCIANWEFVARAMLNQVQRAATWSGEPALHALIRKVLAYPGVPKQWRHPELDGPPGVWLPVELVNLGLPGPIRMVSTITSLQGPLDITLQDLHVEAFYPADAETAAIIAAAG
ncbi:MAG: helix-turn-helix transcriptional regulator [Gammaproteobacteria bacterium]|nr:helix-turn-helix transcriptional regulator [Gammaproteobacteria bacterium]